MKPKHRHKIEYQMLYSTTDSKGQPKFGVAKYCTRCKYKRHGIARVNGWHC